MNRLIQVLAVTTTMFAGTTVYYGQALWREKARNVPAAMQQPQPVDASDHNVEASAGSAGAQSAQRSSSPPPAACPDPARIAVANERLLRVTDAVYRRELVARARTTLTGTWQAIALSMQVQPAELDPLVDMLSERLVGYDQRRAVCQADPQCPPCDLQALNESIKEDRRRSIESHLGPARMAKYEAYLYAITERVYVDAFRSSLDGGNVLDDEKAERLVLALAEERRKFIEQAASQGKRVQVSGAGFNVQEFQGDVAPSPFGPSNWELTAEYNKRIQLVAEQHLVTAQLQAFESMRAERLKNARFIEQLYR